MHINLITYISIYRKTSNRARGSYSFSDTENAGLDESKLPIGARQSVYKTIGLTMDGGGEGFTRQAEFGRYRRVCVCVFSTGIA